MSNMSYCRFRNTLLALEDCHDNMDHELKELSSEEFEARKQLITLCCEIAIDYGEDVDIHLEDK